MQFWCRVVYTPSTILHAFFQNVNLHIKYAHIQYVFFLYKSATDLELHHAQPFFLAHLERKGRLLRTFVHDRKQTCIAYILQPRLL